MSKRCFSVLIVTIGVMISPLLATPHQAADAIDIPRLLDALSDPDASVRKEAIDQLRKLGASARPQLIKAARSDEPELRASAAAILRDLPWSIDSDPPVIRELLNDYGRATDRVRMGIVQQIERRGMRGADVLLRLLAEEHSQAVRWIIVVSLWDSRDPELQKKLRALADGAGDDPPALMIAANGWYERDKPKAIALFRRAIEADEKRPSNDGGILTIAYEQLTVDAIERRAMQEAVELLRRQVSRDHLPRIVRRRGLERYEMPSLAALMALHTYFGPFRGIERDMEAWSARIAGAEPVESVANDIAGFLAEFTSPPPLPQRPVFMRGEDHHAMGAFLLSHKFPNLAEIELRAALEAKEKTQPNIVDGNALFALAKIAADRDDDAAAADLYERAMNVRFAADLLLEERIEDDVWAEIHWRRARAAHKSGDAAATKEHVHNLLQLIPANTDLTINMINWLKESGRNAEAKTFFEKIYVQTRAKLDASPEQQQAGMKNDLAWLCARSDERIGEAMVLSREAVAAQPDNAAFLDTLAEVTFRKGDAAEAARLEERALELSPGNDFMKEQLARFRAGGK